MEGKYLNFETRFDTRVNIFIAREIIWKGNIKNFFSINFETNRCGIFISLKIVAFLHRKTRVFPEMKSQAGLIQGRDCGNLARERGSCSKLSLPKKTYDLPPSPLQ